MRALAVTAIALAVAGCGSDREPATGKAGATKAAPASTAPETTAPETTTTETSERRAKRSVTSTGTTSSPNSPTGSHQGKTAAGRAPNDDSKRGSTASSSNGSAPNEP